MACSKELRVPKEWNKYHPDIANESVDPELFSEDELFSWMEDLDLSHNKSEVAKYVQSGKPYHLMRHQVVLLPKSALSRRLFKLWTMTVVPLFMSDDVLEALSEVEMHKICAGIQLLDDQIRQQFPRFPTIAEMKQSLLLQKVDEKFIPHIIYLLDFANNVAKSIIDQGNFSKEDVNYYWRRLVVTITLYFQGVEVEVKHNVCSYFENVWTRVLASGVMVYSPFQEIVAGSVIKNTEHLSLLNELYFLATVFVMVTNDIYSYGREARLDVSKQPCSMVKTIAGCKEASAESDAVIKCVEILNAVVKTMYQKIEKAKQDIPANQDVCKLLDKIGIATVGWYYWHIYCPRYDDSRWRLSIVGVENDELEEWRKGNDEERLQEVLPLLVNCSSKAKKVSDAIISGVVNMHANLLLE
ncbi:Hypothetical predicted protein [Paramuricea clavata]|uniref:Uncharacterized protein n=1 Tax=Paramuricea clavata TaxID=317549 RepID=A0A7D9JFW3_PARCT|nr:Hypothetical predicted protein [Paramuricea clavata]